MVERPNPAGMAMQDCVAMFSDGLFYSFMSEAQCTMPPECVQLISATDASGH